MSWWHREQELRERRTVVVGELRKILDVAGRGRRKQLSPSEQRLFDKLEQEADRINEELRSLGPAAGQPDARGAYGESGEQDDRSPVLDGSRSVEAWARSHGRNGGDVDAGEPFSLGRAIRGMVTGRWHEAEREHRALSIAVDSAGGFLLPDPLAGQVIDRLRNATRVFQAGAQVVPMTVDELSIARLTGGATVGWKIEGDPITESNMTFDRITLRAKTLPILVKASRELFDDLSPEAASTIEHEIFASLALELDRVLLRGTGTNPVPKGIRNQTGVVIQELGAGNGATPSYDSFLDSIATVRGANGEPNALIQASRTAKTLSKLKTNDLAYLTPPADYTQLTRLVSNQIPVNLTVGTSTDCSEVYVGDFSQVLVGVRTDALSIRVLQERFSDNLQVGLLCWLRADHVLAHPELMVVVTGVRP